MTYEEIAKTMMKTCEDLLKAIDELKEENEFLTETIEKYGLQKIIVERRQLLEEVSEAKRQAARETEEAKRTKDYYQQKIKELKGKV